MATNIETAAAFVMQPPAILLGDFLADMRSWLDNQRIETVGFDIAKGQCEVRFKGPDDARRFERWFS
jgi:hypothetical protein